MVATVEEARKEVGVKDLLEAGLHFGHQTKRWNPKMKRYIFDKRNGIHIIDLTKSFAMLQEALQFLRGLVLSGKSILFVGTKKQAQQIIETTATKCGQHSVTHRWLGGTLTNSATIQRSIKRMRQLEDMEKNGAMEALPKKEVANLRREAVKLRRNLGGIANMGERPGAVFIVDINREAIAVAEANKLGIPVVSIVDTNCDPDPIDYVIPGNDDAIRAIKLIVDLIADTVEKARGEYAKIAAEKAAQDEASRAARAEANRIAQAVEGAADDKSGGERKAADTERSRTTRARSPREKTQTRTGAARKPAAAPAKPAPAAPAAPVEPAAPAVTAEAASAPVEPA